MLLTNKCYPQTEIKKMEDEFYNLSVKGNDLKTYVRRFQELVVLCLNMVPKNEKLMEVFIGGLPRSIKGNVTASKPQSLEEAINIAQRDVPYITKDLAQSGVESATSQGLHVDPVKIEAVKNWSSPTTPTEIRQFLGLAGYYRRFIKDFSKIPKSLTILTQKDKKFVWGKDQEMAFQILKQKLCEAPILALPTMIFSSIVMHQFKKELNMRQRRWLELLADYDCEIHYHPGKANVIADALSQKRIRLRVRMSKTIRFIDSTKNSYWKWERITMDFVTKLPRTSNKHDTIWVIVDRLTKSAHFIPTRETENRDSHFTSRFWQSLQNALGPEIIHETTKKIVQIRQHLQVAKDRQKNYANVRRKPLEFQAGDRVMLKTSPCKGIIRFGKRGKLNPRYIGTFKILKRIGLVAYKLKLPEELINGHNTFHVFNLKKCLSDESFIILMKELKLNDKLNFVEQRVEIMDREIKQLRQSRIPIIKVRWNSKRGPKYTWERKKEIRVKYPHSVF
uniref:Putative reverse transcriptase domain-containing protein n=1 Tax=Tanacetum cinerariifolium TaxID=118510 RepID=A0A699ICG4_TANCI|nr:putative reverse transcriptase domain-containing protein [Tanacetum cinerariifolium]